jgi:O-antigen/teichoic acid export membrane protein
MIASEAEPALAFGELILFVWFELCFVAFVTYLNSQAVGQLGWWNIVGGNIVALAAIIYYFERRHPRIVPRIIERWDMLRDEAASQHREAESRAR